MQKLVMRYMEKVSFALCISVNYSMVHKMCILPSCKFIAHLRRGLGAGGWGLGAGGGRELKTFIGSLYLNDIYIFQGTWREGRGEKCTDHLPTVPDPN